jgi:deoxyribodipyrimidine photo-lyase
VATEADADEVHLAADVSAYAQRREERLRRALEAVGVRLRVHETVTCVVDPGAVAPASSDHFAVFTPYFGHWSRRRLRDPLAAPRTVRVPDGIGSEELPSRTGLSGPPGLSGSLGSLGSPGLSGLSPEPATGGETAGRARLTAWLRSGVAAYEDRRDDLAGDGTSRLSPHLHFGTLSPVELVHRARRAGGAGAEAFVRQLAWRDFHRQVLAARPKTAHVDYRAKHDRWRSAPEEVEAWREGRTGYPVIDAAMRQLRHEGWMHNRGRLLTASFLAKTLYVDWRVGARHFLDLLVDGDVANNQLNWQWVAGTGTDTRPNRILNPVAQAKRYDPDGAYVRRWVPELAGVEGAAVHEPWKLRGPDRAALDYPEPIVGLSQGRERFLRGRGATP